MADGQSAWVAVATALLAGGAGAKLLDVYFQGRRTRSRESGDVVGRTLDDSAAMRGELWKEIAALRERLDEMEGELAFCRAENSRLLAEHARTLEDNRRLQADVMWLRQEIDRFKTLQAGTPPRALPEGDKE